MLLCLECLLTIIEEIFYKLIVCYSKVNSSTKLLWSRTSLWYLLESLSPRHKGHLHTKFKPPRMYQYGKTKMSEMSIQWVSFVFISLEDTLWLWVVTTWVGTYSFVRIV